MRQFGVQLCEFLVTAADFRIGGMLRQFAAVLLTLAMKDQVFFAHSRLQLLKAAAALAVTGAMPFPRHLRTCCTIAIVTNPNPAEFRQIQPIRPLTRMGSNPGISAVIGLFFGLRFRRA